ncbi:TetR family transcriptional regulator [Solihabitans fulvus]|uniref:TetR family transcriptional regulator n=1 Tax=Solihabitans fulvus TaxID=1892852 RepID=A0A5B2X4I6_9PSEU|nr:TetR/AcrR family transcriptional regulator [Solihabitans fulvus]KAA2258031.1 TetR family transcriptional regulator [Solihabitans fulvus]
MRARNSSTEQDAGPPRRTFTESARRAQIVDAAIAVIADLGYAKTSFAKIAKQAGLSSTGMISYHFAGKDDLMRAVVAEVMRVADEHLRPRIEAQPNASARLRTYIESNIALLIDFPKHLAALVEVLANLRDEGPDQFGYAASMDSIMSFQAERMRDAQRTGEFREFDVTVMVHAIRGAIDEVVGRARTDPDLDLVANGRELADLFDRATRNTT